MVTKWAGRVLGTEPSSPLSEPELIVPTRKPQWASSTRGLYWWSISPWQCAWMASLALSCPQTSGSFTPIPAGWEPPPEVRDYSNHCISVTKIFLTLGSFQIVVFFFPSSVSETEKISSLLYNNPRASLPCEPQETWTRTCKKHWW